MTVLHFVLVAAAIAIGIFLLTHPVFMKGKSRLFRGTVIWFVLILILRGLDYAFQP